LIHQTVADWHTPTILVSWIEPTPLKLVGWVQILVGSYRRLEQCNLRHVWKASFTVLLQTRHQ